VIKCVGAATRPRKVVDGEKWFESAAVNKSGLETDMYTRECALEILHFI